MSLTNLDNSTIQATNLSDCPMTVNQCGNSLVDVLKINGSAIDQNSGNKSDGSVRVCIASDDVNLAAIKTSLENIETHLENISDILTDVYISASHRLRVLAQAL